VNAVIRVATTTDAEELAALRYEFRSSLREPVVTAQEFLPRCTAWMRERLQRSSWQCWIAERQDAVVGNLWCSLIDKIPNPIAEPELHASITNFYVRPSNRGQGVGSELLHTALDWCRTRNVDAVILWPTEQSRSLYERHGFAVSDDLLELRLPS
jgi:GNAT superfamily N-acetyltransferase